MPVSSFYAMVANVPDSHNYLAHWLPLCLAKHSEQNEQKYGETCPGLPKDIINFQYDPLTCAIALGWREGVEFETVPLKLEIRENWLYEVPDSDGMPTCVVTKVDGNAFNGYWCKTLLLHQTSIVQ